MEYGAQERMTFARIERLGEIFKDDQELVLPVMRQRGGVNRAINQQYLTLLGKYVNNRSIGLLEEVHTKCLSYQDDHFPAWFFRVLPYRRLLPVAVT